MVTICATTAVQVIATSQQSARIACSCVAIRSVSDGLWLPRQTLSFSVPTSRSNVMMRASCVQLPQ